MVLLLGIFAGDIGKGTGFKRSWYFGGTSGALGCLVEWLPGRVTWFSVPGCFDDESSRLKASASFKTKE